MNSKTANDTQIGGDHYKDLKMEPWDFILESYGPAFLIGNAVKYVARHRSKGGPIDLDKVSHYLDKLAEAVIEGHQIPEASHEILETFLQGVHPGDAGIIRKIVTVETVEDIRRTNEAVQAHRRHRYN